MERKERYQMKNESEEIKPISLKEEYIFFLVFLILGTFNIFFIKFFNYSITEPSIGYLHFVGLAFCAYNMYKILDILVLKIENNHLINKLNNINKEINRIKDTNNEKDR